MVKRGIRDRWDFVIVVDGREGSGKSTLALHMKAIYDGRYNLDNVLFDAGTMVELMEKVDRRSCVLVDEAVLSLYKRESLRDFQIQLVKAFSIVRARNLFFILCLPNFNDLDPNIRTRCNYRFYAHAKRGVRGYLDVYQPRRTPWSAGSLYQELIWTYKFPALPESFQGTYDEFKETNLHESLITMDEEIKKALAQDRSRSEFGRTGTIKERIWSYLDDNPDADRFEVGNQFKCTPAYARDIISAHRGYRKVPNEAGDTEKETGS